MYRSSQHACEVRNACFLHCTAGELKHRNVHGQTGDLWWRRDWNTGTPSRTEQTAAFWVQWQFQKIRKDNCFRLNQIWNFQQTKMQQKIQFGLKIPRHSTGNIWLPGIFKRVDSQGSLGSIQKMGSGEWGPACLYDLWPSGLSSSLWCARPRY